MRYREAARKLCVMECLCKGTLVRKKVSYTATKQGNHLIIDDVPAWVCEQCGEPLLIRFPSQRFWVDYDAEADVLYISFERPQKATDSVMTDEGVLLRYRGDSLVGVTILEASARMAM